MIKLFDYACDSCGIEEERAVKSSEQDEQLCFECGTKMRRCITCKPEAAFTPHYSSSLGMLVESRQHRRDILNDIRERSVECLPRHKRKRKVLD